MAAAKKKTATKRTVKYAAKAQSSAKNASAHAASAGAAWTKNTASKGAADWQKGASDWAKHSAKLYQLPFGQGDASDVAKNAADSVKSATENMVKMGTDMMQQFFSASKKTGVAPDAFNLAAMFKNMPKMPEFDAASMFKSMPQMPNFDMASMFKNMPQMPSFDAASLFKAAPGFDGAAIKDKFTTMARESAAHVNKSTTSANRVAEESAALSREHVQTAIEVTNIAVSVSKELAAELVSYANKVFSQNVDLSKQVLSCRTLNDMFDLSTRITKSNLDAFFSESVKISEMVFQCATDVSEPLNEHVSNASERLTKVIAS